MGTKGYLAAISKVEKEDRGCHLFIQAASLSLSGLSRPLLVLPRIFLPGLIPVTMETEARSSLKDANTELAPKSGEGRRKVRRKRQASGS